MSTIVNSVKFWNLCCISKILVIVCASSSQELLGAYRIKYSHFCSWWAIVCYHIKPIVDMMLHIFHLHPSPVTKYFLLYLYHMHLSFFSLCLFKCCSVTESFHNVLHVSYLVAAAGLQSLWSLTLAIVDIYALLVGRSLQNYRVVSLFAVGDGVRFLIWLT